MSFVKSPNLPQGRLKRAIVGNHPEVIAVLHSFGTEVIVAPENKSVQQPVRSHADMTVLHMGGDSFISYDETMASELRSIGAKCGLPELTQSSVYPHDIGLNCLIIGKYLVCNTRYCDSNVLKIAIASGRDIIDVNQGYARCSTAVIDEHSVITADKGIAKRLLGETLDVLLIRQGFIELPGYDHGFIGGCCAKLSSDKILFCGDVMTHPDGAEIKEFISARGIEIISTGDHQLFDFGGVVCVEEYDSTE